MVFGCKNRSMGWCLGVVLNGFLHFFAGLCCGTMTDIRILHLGLRG